MKKALRDANTARWL